MATLLSPGVQVIEEDRTDIIPALATSVAGFAGYFKWGPCNNLVTISSEKELAKVYGAPSAPGELETSFFTAASFLKYGNHLKVIRANDAAAVNATSSTEADDVTTGGDGSVTPISSLDEVELAIANTELVGADIVARFGGALGNSLRVYVVTNQNWVALTAYSAALTGSLPYQPTTTVWTEDFLPGTTVQDECHVVVVDELGLFTGQKGTILETFVGKSLGSNAKDQYGESNFYGTFINNNSSYIWVPTSATAEVLDGVSVDDLTPAWLGNGANDSLVLDRFLDDFGGGVDTVTFVPSDVVDALEFFADPEKVDINLLFGQSFNEEAAYSASDTKVVDDKILTILASRRDLVGFISAPLKLKTKTNDDDRKDDLLEKFDSIGSSSYVVFDSSPLYIYNKYLDTYLWIPAAGHMAGLCAHTDEVTDPWFSPAGFNRGILLGVTKLAYNPNQAHRDEIYKARVNPIVSFPGQGIALYGDKTGLTKPSAFDRINVRRLFVTVEKAIAEASKFRLFELNDEFTRSAFRNTIIPYLRDVQGRRGITDFRVVCDESNNTGEVIDGNRFVADIYIKPARSINFITLNFIATRTGASFQEIVGR